MLLIPQPTDAANMALPSSSLKISIILGMVSFVVYLRLRRLRFALVSPWVRGPGTLVVINVVNQVHTAEPRFSANGIDIRANNPRHNKIFRKSLG